MSLELSRAVDQLGSSGFNITKDTPIFLAGHSLGGAMIQIHILDEKVITSFPAKVAGIILLGMLIEFSVLYLICLLQVFANFKGLLLPEATGTPRFKSTYHRF